MTMTTTTLEIRLLGVPQIKLAGQPLQGFISRKAEALFYYLAVTGSTHSRSSLLTLFWPETPEDKARNNLRTALSNLRRLLGDYLVIDRYSAAFDAQSDHWLDVTEFNALRPDALEQVDSGHLEMLLGLYRGDFLDGFFVRDAPAFEIWVGNQHQTFRMRAVQIMEALTDRRLERGEFARALAVNKKLLELEPWDERAHRQRMELLARSGQRSAALAQYEACRHILAREFNIEPSPATTALYQSIRAGDLAGPAPEPEIAARKNGKKPASLAVVETPAQDEISSWSDIPAVETFYGRDREITLLHRWLVTEGARLVGIFGFGGQGKTTLAAHIARLLAPGPCSLWLDPPASGAVQEEQTPDQTAPFACVLWRSLLNAPPLNETLQACIQQLSDHQVVELPHSLDEQLRLLIHYLRHRRALLIFDNVEAIMEEDERAGYYRAGYEGYGQVFQWVAEHDHRSCLLLTSREVPQGWALLAASAGSARDLQLAGLAPADGQKLLQEYGLAAAGDTLRTLVHHYSGNPLAFRLVATTIQEVFGGDVQAFLDEETLIFDNIRDILEQQCNRLSPSEQALMNRLAIEREPVSYQALRAHLAQSAAAWTTLEALRSLQRRSLVKSYGNRFGLQNVVMAYVTDRLRRDARSGGGEPTHPYLAEASVRNSGRWIRPGWPDGDQCRRSRHGLSTGP